MAHEEVTVGSLATLMGVRSDLNKHIGEDSHTSHASCSTEERNGVIPLTIPVVKSTRGRPKGKRNQSKKMQAQLFRISDTHRGLCGAFQMKFERLVQIKQNEWLSDPVINVAQGMLHNKFPAVAGLQDAVLGQRLLFKQQSGFLQILHLPNHWVTASNYGAPKGTAVLYNSLGGQLASKLAKQLCNIMRLSSGTLKIQVKAVQHQENTYDCGVYAIANASSLASGNDPCSLGLINLCLVVICLNVFSLGELLQFPYTTAEIRRTYSYKMSVCVINAQLDQLYSNGYQHRNVIFL